MIAVRCMISPEAGVKVEPGGVDRWDRYAGRVTTTGGNARWARGLAVALVTAPGVLLAQLVVTGNVPALGVALVVCVVVPAVAVAVPSRSAVGTAAVAAAAQFAGHVVLAFAAP